MFAVRTKAAVAGLLVPHCGRNAHLRRRAALATCQLNVGDPAAPPGDPASIPAFYLRAHPPVRALPDGRALLPLTAVDHETSKKWVHARRRQALCLRRGPPRGAGCFDGAGPTFRC